MDKSREQFETWYAKHMKLHVSWYNDGNIKNDLTTCEDGSYMRTSVRNKWESWQASRAAVEIELPEVTEKRWWSSWYGQFRYEAFWLEVRRVLVSHGLKVVSK